ncbi:MAG: hypothetical protein Fur0022_14840 [Anaerolineales bacterium]
MSVEKSQKVAFAVFGFLGAIQGAFSVWLYSQIPSAGSLLFGLTLERLILIGSVIILGGFFFLFGVGTWQNWTWAERLRKNWHPQLQTPVGWGLWLVGSVLLLISGSFFTLITPEIAEPFAAAYFLRLQPLALLLAGLAGQTLLILPLLRDGSYTLHKNPELLRVVGLYGVFLLLAGGIDLHLRRIDPDPVGWNTLGTPLLDTQVLFVFLIGMLLVGVIPGNIRSSRKPLSPGWKFDLLICIVLWMAAAWYWSTLPLASNWYMASPRYPTFSFFPNSDAVVYDTTAQSLLTGMGYQSSDLPFPRRPLYDLFLFGLYLLKGQNYEAVVGLQSILFGIFPALVYWMTKTMHTRLSGIIAGLLVLFREGNNIALTGVITVSHSKMAMSDFPTAIGVVLLAWVAFRWLAASDQPKRLALILIAGGSLGAAMQIRVETGVFIPVIFGFALLQLPQLKARYMTSLLAFLGCLTLVLAPWVYRNWLQTGLIFLETPDARLTFLLDRMRRTSDDEMPQITPTQEGGKTLTPRQKPTPSQHDQETPAPSFPQILLNHWLHSQSHAILLFPNTYRIFDSTIGLLGHQTFDTFWTQCCSGRDYVKRLPFWDWGKWSGEIPPQTVVPILVNLFVLAVGFRQAWKKAAWNGLFLAGMAWAYYFANALARTSGGRYLMAVDWVWVVYYSLGLASLITGLFKLFGRQAFSIWTESPEPALAETAPRLAQRPVWPTYFAICAGFFTLGVSIPAAEAIFPPRYTKQTLQTWLAEFTEADQTRTLAPQLNEFIANGGLIWQGRGLYLRYYGKDQGESGSLYPAVYPQPYPRLNIFLVGPEGIGVSLPLTGRPNIRAENAADVLIFGCEKLEVKGSYFDALAMFYPATGEIFFRQPFPETLTCPLPAP